MKAADSTKERSFFSIFLIIFTLLVVFTSITTVIGLNIYKRDILTDHKNRALDQILIQKRLMISHFDSIESDLIFLSNIDAVRRYISTGRETDRSLIETDYYEFIKSRTVYDQLRYIDKSGKETVRINFNTGAPDIVAAELLQDKSGRYYFEESLNISKGAVYISPFDLNIENGEIEQPLKPMIRFGTPVYQSAEPAASGIVILNYLGENIINDLKEAASLHSGSFSLLNSEGYWLYNNNPAEEWAFMYPDRNDLKLSIKNPDLWSNISESAHNQFLYNSALYTANTVDISFRSGSSEFSRTFIIINTISYKQMGIDSNTLNLLFLKIFLFALVVVTVLSVFISIILQQRNRYRNELQRTAFYDQLTDLPNRILLQERAAMTINHALRYKHSYAVLFIDLDGFKAVNDTFGHTAGDMLLIETGQLLSGCIRNTDTAARIGGDEFIVLLSEVHSPKDAETAAEKISRKLDRTLDVENSRIHISCSIGAAVASATSLKDFDLVIKAADDEMYKVKDTGKNNFSIVEL